MRYVSDVFSNTNITNISKQIWMIIYFNFQKRQHMYKERDLRHILSDTILLRQNFLSISVVSRLNKVYRFANILRRGNSCKGYILKTVDHQVPTVFLINCWRQELVSWQNCFLTKSMWFHYIKKLETQHYQQIIVEYPS